MGVSSSSPPRPQSGNEDPQFVTAVFENFTQFANTPQNNHSPNCKFYGEGFRHVGSEHERDFRHIGSEHERGFRHIGSEHERDFRHVRSEHEIGFRHVGSEHERPFIHKELNHRSITSKELANARKMWGDGLVAISIANDQKGLQAATQVAKQVIDELYGYNLGPVLFKPTLTTGAHIFRTNRDSALAYFVGQNPRFPNDNGFALRSWRKVDNVTAAEFINGDVAIWMGVVTITDRNGNIVIVYKSWGYKKGLDGKLRIVLHHSSLPYIP